MKLLPLLVAISLFMMAPAFAQDSDPFAGDARLQKKLTIKAVGIPLKELLEQLTKETGIQLVAGPRVLEDEIVLFAYEKPLVDTLRVIARYFRFYWGRTGQPGHYAYTLSQSLRQLREEEAEAAQSYIAAANQIVKDARELQQFADMPPDQVKVLLEAARAELANTADPARKEQLNSRLSALTQLQNIPSLPQVASLLANEGPDRIIAVLRGDLLRFDSPPYASTKPLDPTVTERIFQGFRATRPPGQEERQYNVASVKFIGAESGLPMVQVQVNAGLRTENSFSMAGRGTTLPLTAVMAAGEGSIEPAKWKENPLLTRSASLSLPFKPLALAPGPVQLPPPSFASAIEKLQDSLHFDFISGAFYSTTGPYLELSARPVGEILTAISQNTLHRWTFESGFVQMRARGYAQRRANEPSVFALRRWAAMQDDSLFSLDQVAEIMAQPTPKMEVTLGVLNTYRGMQQGHELRQYKSQFVLWNALSKSQRAAALSSGLPYRSLISQVRALYEVAVSNPRNPLDEVPSSPSRLTPAHLMGSLLSVTHSFRTMWGVRKGSSHSMSGSSREQALENFRRNEPGFNEKDLREVRRSSYQFVYGSPGAEPITIRFEVPAIWMRPSSP